MRGRSYSYSPSPPRSYGRRGRSPSPRGHGRDPSTSLLVRNLRHDCRVEDLRRPFGQFGPLKDVYLPRDYYTSGQGRRPLCLPLSEVPKQEPRGFGFVQYVDPADAAEAKYQMDGQILLGRELTVVFAEENRKKPADMRARDRVRGRAVAIGDLHAHPGLLHHAIGQGPGVSATILLHLVGSIIRGRFHLEQSMSEGCLIPYLHLIMDPGVGALRKIMREEPTEKDLHLLVTREVVSNDDCGVGTWSWVFRQDSPALL